MSSRENRRTHEEHPRGESIKRMASESHWMPTGADSDDSRSTMRRGGRRNAL